MKKVTKQYLEGLKPSYIEAGYTVPKWIGFCEAMLDHGYSVSLTRSKSTVSKYIYLIKGLKKLKVRFSNHKARRDMEHNGDCDYYVGRGNKGIITTEGLIKHLLKE